MRIVLRVALGVFALVCLLIGAGYFYLTNPGVQQRFADRILAEAGSVESVRITFSEIDLRRLKLRADDATMVTVDRLRADFSLFAALFGKTIKARELVVSGLRIDLPDGLDTDREGVESNASDPTVAGDFTYSVDSSRPTESTFTYEERSESLGLSQFVQIPWLIDIEKVLLDGCFLDAQGSTHEFECRSTPMQPGSETRFTAEIISRLNEAKASGLACLNTRVEVAVRQKKIGGFDDVAVRLKSSGNDSLGAELLTLKQTIDLEVSNGNKEAVVMSNLDIEVGDARRLLPQFGQFETIRVVGALKLGIQQERLSLSKIDFTVAGDGVELVAIDLKKEFVIGGSSVVGDELVGVVLNDISALWLRPLLPSGWHLDFDPFSISASIVSTEGGGFKFGLEKPLQIENVQVKRAGDSLLEGLNLSGTPSLQLSADRTFQVAVPDLSIADRYGVIMSGNGCGRTGCLTQFDKQAFGGIAADVDMNLKLQPVLNQPLFAGKTSIVGGDLKMSAKMNVSAAKQIKLSADLGGLRTRGMPRKSRDFSLDCEAENIDGKQWRAHADLRAGPLSKPFTDLNMEAIGNLGSDPIEFELQLSAQRIRQSDLMMLVNAFQPVDVSSTALPVSTIRSAPLKGTSVPQMPVSTSDHAATTQRPDLPPWAEIAGSVSFEVGEWMLNSRQSIEQITGALVVSEPLLELRELSAQLGGGDLFANVRINYESEWPSPYKVSASGELSGFDPQVFAHDAKPPISGSFDMALKFEGEGDTVDGAFEHSNSSLRLVGTDGSVTAFEIEDRHLAGISLIGGLLGKELGRPGISAATDSIPYFKDIGFSNFEMGLERQRSGRIAVSSIQLLGDSIYIEGGGGIEASAWDGIMTAPMDLRLQFGARGDLERLLDRLELLEAEAAVGDYRLWNQLVRVTGSLEDPDTRSLKQVLTNAASSAIRKPQNEREVTDESNTREEVQNEASTPDRELRHDGRNALDEVEMSLELINSFLGN